MTRVSDEDLDMLSSAVAAHLSESGADILDAMHAELLALRKIAAEARVFYDKAFDDELDDYHTLDDLLTEAGL